MTNSESKQGRRLRLARDRNKRWRLAFPEKAKACRKSWERRNPEQRRVSKNAWARRNPVKQKVRRIRWRQRHPDRHKQIKRGHQVRWISELRPGYVRQLVNGKRYPISPTQQKIKTQIHRTRTALNSLALAAILSP